MACCPPTISFFADQLTTTIPYSDALKALHGQKPRVDLYYWDDVELEFYTLNDFPLAPIKFTGSNIIIDHGGLASGYVKIS